MTQKKSSKHPKTFHFIKNKNERGNNLNFVYFPINHNQSEFLGICIILAYRERLFDFTPDLPLLHLNMFYLDLWFDIDKENCVLYKKGFSRLLLNQRRFSVQWISMKFLPLTSKPQYNDETTYSPNMAQIKFTIYVSKSFIQQTNKQKTDK